MISSIFQLFRRPYFTSECLLAGFLFFFLVLSGQRFAKFATICGGLSVLFFVFEAIYRSQLGKLLTKLKPLIPYFFFLGLSVLVLPLIPYAHSRVWNIFTGLLILIVSFSIVRRFGRAQVLEYAFPLVVCGLCFLMLVAPGLVGAEASTEGDRVNFKATGLGEGGGMLSSHFSVIVGIAVFLSLGVLCEGGFRLRKLFTLQGAFHVFSMLLGFYLIVVLSGSRQGLIWLFLGMMYCYVLYTKRQWFLGIIFWVPVGLLIIGVGYFFFEETLTVQRLIAIFDPVARTFNPEKSLEGRLYMIQVGFDLWKESPIWGNGNEAFRVHTGGENYSHNNYIELLANYGALGFLFYYIPMVTALIISVRKFLTTRHEQIKKDYLWVVFCIVAILASNMFMPSYYMKHMLMFLGIVIGRLYYIREQSRRMPQACSQFRGR